MAKLEAGYTYTDAELLALYREAFAKLSVGGQHYRIEQREFTAADLDEIRATIDWLESRVASAETGMVFSPVKRGRT